MRRAGWVGVVTVAAIALGGAWGSGNDERSEKKTPDRRCSDATLQGTYGIQIQGTRPSAPDGPIEAVVGVVIRDYDGRGEFTQVDNVKGSISGIVPDREGFGTYEVKEDCTAVVYLEPFPGLSTEERLVIVKGGDEVLSMVLSPPPAMVTGIQKKVHEP